MAEVRYTKSHEWCRLEDGVGVCGITQHAVDELGDLTFLDYRVEAGQDVAAGDPFGEIDSVKATSELFAPVSGAVEAINERFQDEEQLGSISTDPQGEGWMVKIKISDPAQFEALLDEAAYQEHCANG